MSPVWAHPILATIWKQKNLVFPVAGSIHDPTTTPPHFPPSETQSSSDRLWDDDAQVKSLRENRETDEHWWIPSGVGDDSKAQCWYCKCDIFFHICNDLCLLTLAPCWWKLCTDDLSKCLSTLLVNNYIQLVFKLFTHHFHSFICSSLCLGHSVLFRSIGVEEKRKRRRYSISKKKFIHSFIHVLHEIQNKLIFWPGNKIYLQHK